MHPLRKHRKAAGITLAKLAERIGVSEGQLSKIECGESGTTLETAAAIEREIGFPAVNLAKQSDAAA